MGLERKFRILVPGRTSNLNRKEPNRGWTQLLLHHAGWDFYDYSPGEKTGYYELTIKKRPKGTECVEFIAVRPKDMPVYLSEGLADLAICGRDIMEEWYSKMWHDKYYNLFTIDIEKSFKELSHNPEFKSFVRKKFNKRKIDNLETLKIFSWFFLIESDLKDRKNKSTYCNLSNSPWKKIREKIIDLKDTPFVTRKESISELCDLGYGKVDVVWAIKQDEKTELEKELGKDLAISNLIMHNYSSSHDLRIKCATSYPNLAYGEFLKYLPAELINFIPRGYSTSFLEQVMILPLNSTELAIKSNIADLILECVASRDSLKTQGAIQIDKPLIKNSTARVYKSDKFNYYTNLASENGLIFGDLYYLIELNNKFGFGLEEDIRKLEQQRIKFLPFYKERNLVYKINDKWRDEKIAEILKKLQKAARKYGDTRPDSIYFKGRK